MPDTSRMVPEAEFETRLRFELERRAAVTPAMLHSIDDQGRLISVSDMWLAKLGYTRDEVLGRRSSDFLTPESREYAVREVLPEFFRLGRCDNIQYQMVRKDGDVIDVLLSAVLEDDPSGHGRVSLAAMTDITALKQTKHELAESEARYRGLVEDQSELVSLTSPDGELRYVNHAYAAFYGRRPEEMVGRNLFEFVPEEGRAALAEHLRQVCTAGCSLENENQVVLPDGEKRWLQWSNRALTDSSGRVTAIQSIGRDIEERVQAQQRLRDSETRYRLLADNSSDIIALLGRDGTRLYVSPACRRLTGFEPEEMLLQRTADTTHPDDAKRVLEALASDSEGTTTYRMLRKKGDYVWVETTCKPVEIEGMEDLRLAVVRDIDARVRAERGLQESESRYRFLAENSADMILLVGSDGKRLYASPASKALLGYEPKEMLAIRTEEAIHPDDAERVLDILANGSADPAQTHTLSYRMQRKDGSYLWVETTGRAVDVAGQTDQRLLIVRDIDQRMQTERRLKESETRYRLLADNSTDMVFQLDHDLVREYVSPACRELLGYEPEEMIGVKPVSMAHPDDAPRLELVFQTLMSGRADRHAIINRIRHRNGKWVWVEAQFRAVKDSDTGRPNGIIGALRDISARKVVEDELAEANRRLQALAGQDSLTGLANRRAFDEALAKEHRRSKREKKPLGLIMIDVDRFKAFNDRYGHPAGDDCLRRVGRAIAEAICRPGDLAARYGGEEFAVLLPDTDEAGAEVIAERVRQAVVDLALRHDANAGGVVTISAGAASLLGGEAGESPEFLVNRADQALYRAKDGGRNAVVRASSVLPGAAPTSQAVA